MQKQSLVISPEEILIKVSKILEDLKIPYAITGGFAVAVWGNPRNTADIDVIIELVKNDIKPLLKSLLTIDKNAYVDEDMANDALARKSEFNVVYPSTGMKIDFFLQDPRNPYHKAKMKRVVAKDIFGQIISFISPEDLIVSKLLWAKESESYKQIQDIKAVLNNKKLPLDMNYIKRWAKKHETIGMLNDILAGKIFRIIEE